MTGVLEQLGVPLLYLGDLFKRAEIRDLLSLIALDAEYGGVGLVRVAALPDYQVSRDEALEVIRWAQAQRVTISRRSSAPPRSRACRKRGGRALPNWARNSTASALAPRPGRF